MNFSDVKRWYIPEGVVYRVVDSNNRVIWERSGYFYVEDTSGQSNTLTISKTNTNAPTIEVFYSTDTVNWVSMGNTSTTGITATVPANDKLYLKAVVSRWCVSQSNNYYNNKIVVSGSHNIGGNIMSLISGDNYLTTNTINTYAFRGLFSGNSTLVEADQLILPIYRLATECYSFMFSNCTSLTKAPELPATTLATSCYRYMFNNCIALTTPPPVLRGNALPLTCYAYMFNGCTALTTAPVIAATYFISGTSQNCSYMFNSCTALTTPPELPITTLADQCYGAMFMGCTSLTTAPVLPATTLVYNCYGGMFSGCSNLNSVTTYAQDISASNCLNGWLNGVSATGDFYNLGGATYPSGTSGIPSGWTEHTSL